MEIAVEIFIALLTLVFVFYPLITERPSESVSLEMDIEAQILSLRKRNVPAGAVNDREVLNRQKEDVNPLADAEERISKLRKQNLAGQGTPQAQTSKSRQGKSKECPKCGSTNPTDARFCSECATKLTKDR
jgi:ribosomal protein L40E